MVRKVLEGEPTVRLEDHLIDGKTADKNDRNFWINRSSELPHEEEEKKEEEEDLQYINKQRYMLNSRRETSSKRNESMRNTCKGKKTTQIHIHIKE